jgi:beta-barrel assembly-enhancing protease
MNLKRRHLVTHGLCACVLGCVQPLAAKVLDTHLTPLIPPGYKPVDDDEKGLWQQCEALEGEVSGSPLLLGDKRLTAYVAGVVARLLPDRTREVRVYVLRDPEFNASMAPNGMLLVYSGLLARMRNEAQLAAVLGHECGHYLRRHTLQGYREMKSKTATAAFLSAGIVGIAINPLLYRSLSSYSRSLESEADAYSLELLAAAGYPPQTAAQIWTQLIAERRASAAGRNKKYVDESTSALSTHPPTAERLVDLTDSAEQMEHAGHAPYDERRRQWQAAIAPHRAGLLDEQVKLNDPGASLYLINALAQDGWDGILRYYEGEVYRLRGDSQQAGDTYAEAVKFPDAPAQAYKAYGYAQIKAGHSQEGRRALERYLQLAPDAPDAAMVRSMAGVPPKK